MSKDDVFVLGEGIERRDRTLKSGAVKQRYTVTIKSDKIRMDFNEKKLGEGPAKAMLALIQERIEGITSVAAPATLKARKVAAKAFALGKPWAMRRWSGGRTGPMPPNQSDRLFNDSGRFWKAMAIGFVEGRGWIVNFAAARLNPTTTSGEAGVLRIWERLKELVPELADMGKLMDSIPVRNAVNKAVDAMYTKIDSKAWDNGFRIVDEVVGDVNAIDEDLGEKETG